MEMTQEEIETVEPAALIGWRPFRVNWLRVYRMGTALIAQTKHPDPDMLQFGSALRSRICSEGAVDFSGDSVCLEVADRSTRFIQEALQARIELLAIEGLGQIVIHAGC